VDRREAVPSINDALFVESKALPMEDKIHVADKNSINDLLADEIKDWLFTHFG
jgi:hypothetical protein